MCDLPSTTNCRDRRIYSAMASSSQTPPQSTQGTVAIAATVARAGRIDLALARYETSKSLREFSAPHIVLNDILEDISTATVKIPSTRSRKMGKNPLSFRQVLDIAIRPGTKSRIQTLKLTVFSIIGSPLNSLLSPSPPLQTSKSSSSSRM